MRQSLKVGKAPLVLVGILALVALIWFGRQALLGSGAGSGGDLSYGIQRPAPDVVSRVLPEVKSRPLFLEFRTRLCFDCKQLAPLVAAVARQHPAIPVLSYDLETDRNARPGIFDAFQPVTVPTIVTLKTGGTIQQVLYGVPKQSELNAAFDALK